MKPPIDPQLAARAELATPLRYHLTVVPARPSLLERIIDAIGTFLQRIFAHVHLGGGGASVVVWGVVAIAVGLFAFLIARVVQAQARERSRAADAVTMLGDDEAALARAADDAAARGDLRTAVRLLLRATVTMLDERGEIDDEASATIGELRSEVARRGAPVATPFDEIAATFVSGIYAELPIDAPAWRRARGAYERLRAAAAA